MYIISSVFKFVLIGFAVLALLLIGQLLTCMTSDCQEHDVSLGDLDYEDVADLGPYANVEQPKTDYSSTVHQYQDDFDLRILVLTYKRHESLTQVLNSLQDLVLDGDKAVVEIWIDRDVNGTVDEMTYRTARGFRWRHGPVRVHVHGRHVGVYGQWINTWRPRGNDARRRPLSDAARPASGPEHGELVIYLEDDTDISPYGYRWLRALHGFYSHRADVSGYTLQDENAVISRGPGTNTELPRPAHDPVFLYRIPGSWGLAPHPDRWREFQDWFHRLQAAPDFKPYVPKASMHTEWFKIFERQHRADSMWTMWFIRFCDDNDLFTVYSNLPTYTNRTDVSLVSNRKEAGMHYTRRPQEASVPSLMRDWDSAFVSFSYSVRTFDYDGGSI